MLYPIRRLSRMGLGVDPLIVGMGRHVTAISLSVFYYLRPFQVILGTSIPDCEVGMGWACICRVRPSSYGYLEMLRSRIVPRKEHWLGRSQVRVDYFGIRELGTCGFVDVRALE